MKSGVSRKELSIEIESFDIKNRNLWAPVKKINNHFIDKINIEIAITTIRNQIAKTKLFDDSRLDSKTFINC